MTKKKFVRYSLYRVQCVHDPSLFCHLKEIMSNKRENFTKKKKVYNIYCKYIIVTPLITNKKVI